MTTSEILSNISRGWNCAPTGCITAVRRPGISVALWQYDKAKYLELSGTADCHLVTVQLLPAGTLEIASDNRRKSGPFYKFSCDITQAGETCAAVLNGRVEILQFYIHPHYFSDFLESEGIASTPGSIELVDPQGRQDALISRISLDAALEIRDPQPFSRLKIEALGQELAIHLLRNYSNVFPHLLDQRRGSLSTWQLRCIIDYLEDHLNEDVSLDDLSRLVGLSRFHVCRSFKQAIGLPPHRWVLARRIERAQALLRETDLSVTSIALQHGFSSSQHFAATFRKFTGASPTDFRAERQLHSGQVSVSIPQSAEQGAAPFPPDLRTSRRPQP